LFSHIANANSHPTMNVDQPFEDDFPHENGDSSTLPAEQAASQGQPRTRVIGSDSASEANSDEDEWDDNMIQEPTNDLSEDVHEAETMWDLIDEMIIQEAAGDFYSNMLTL
jgi:hypothetical protein